MLFDLTKLCQVFLFDVCGLPDPLPVFSTIGIHCKFF